MYYDKGVLNLYIYLMVEFAFLTWCDRNRKYSQWCVYLEYNIFDENCMKEVECDIKKNKWKQVIKMIFCWE